jgi:hypothetical protein
MITGTFERKITHLAYGSWNVDTVDHYAGHIGSHGHGGHVGCGYDHNSAFHSRSHDYRHVCRGHFRSRVNGHHNCLLLAHPNRNEKDRMSFCGEECLGW